MTHEISRREVLNNLIRFKDNLLEMRGEEERQQGRQDLEEREKEGRKGDRTYKVLLNRKTGDMRFAQKISAMEHHISRKGMKKESPADWKEVQIIVHESPSRSSTSFEVRDLQNRSLKPSDIDPLAWRIASETVDILNKKAKEIDKKHPEMLLEEAVLQDLSSVHLSVHKEHIEEFPGWMGMMSRVDAEEKLTGKPIGTYLLRQGDEITLSIAFHVSEENLLSIHPYILTVVEKDQKITDILLLKTEKGWTFYQDDPNLQDPITYHFFPSLQAILHHLNGTANYPVV